MLSYIVRRVLLFVPTILGATFLVFMLMALAPIDIIDSMLPPGGEQKQGQRENRAAYLNARYGLDQPPPMQYLRWLNNVSPVGVPTWGYDEPPVVESRAQRRAWREERQAELLAAEPELAGDQEELIDRLNALEEQAEAAGQVDFSPRPGSPKAGSPFKAPSLGRSFIYQRSTWSLIADALPVTLLLNALSIPLALVISIATGVWSARHRGGWQDWGTGTLLLALFSIPTIWVGVMSIGFLANVQYFKLFPAAGLNDVSAGGYSFFPSAAGRGYLLDSVWHLGLPLLCLTYTQFAYLSKLTRTSLLETLTADYIRTARAKGLPPGVVLWRHGFRNSLIPLITFLAALLPAIITGSVVVETIFSIDGMGRLTIEALKRNDREVFLSVTLIILILKLIAYLLADIAYAIADPRVSYS